MTVWSKYILYSVALTLMKFIQTTTPIQICDIGASPIDKTEFIEILLDKTNSNIIGFKPNKDEFIKLEQSSKKEFTESKKKYLKWKNF